MLHPSPLTRTHRHRLEYVLLALGYTGLLLELVIGAITLIVFQRYIIAIVIVAMISFFVLQEWTPRLNLSS